MMEGEYPLITIGCGACTFKCIPLWTLAVADWCLGCSNTFTRTGSCTIPLTSDPISGDEDAENMEGVEALGKLVENGVGVEMGVDSADE